MPENPRYSLYRKIIHLSCCKISNTFIHLVRMCFHRGGHLPRAPSPPVHQVCIIYCINLVYCTQCQYYIYYWRSFYINLFVLRSINRSAMKLLTQSFTHSLCFSLFRPIKRLYIIQYIVLKVFTSRLHFYIIVSPLLFVC